MKIPWINIQDYPVILGQNKNSFLTNTCSFVLGYEINLAEIYTLGREDFDAINIIWEQALKSLPSGTIIHKQDYYLDTPLDTSFFPCEHFIEKATVLHFKGRNLTSHRSLLFFSYPKANTLTKVGLSFALKKIDLREYQSEKNFINYEFSNEVKKAVEYLDKSSFFKLRALSELEINDFSRFNLNLINQGTTTGSFNLNEETKNQKISTKIGDQILGMYGLINEENFPSLLSSKVIDDDYSSKSFVFYKGLGDSFGLSLGFSHIYNQIIYIDNRAYWIGQIEKKKEVFKSLRYFSPQMKIQAESLEKMLEDIYKSDQEVKFSRCHFNVVFWHQEIEKFTKYANEISNKFKSLDIRYLFPKGKELGHLFFNSHFANVSNFSNMHLALLPLDAALCFFTNVSSYKSDPKGILFNDRLTNIPIKKDVWDEEKKRIMARNFAIFAPTGEGKSVLANHIIRQFIDQGYTVVIVDLGGSYEKLCHLYPDKSLYYKFEENSPINYNPFFVKDRNNISSSKIESLSEFVFIHIKREAKASEIERASLRKILIFYFQNLEDRQEVSFIHFIEFVNKNKEEICLKCELSEELLNFKEFKLLSEEFVGTGVYSFLYRETRDNQMNFKDKQLIVADLDQVKENEFLLSIYIQIINDATYTNIWEDKKKKGIVLYDEFAKQLQFGNGSVLNRVIYYAQAIRKQNGALGIILQSINQLPDKAEVRAMIENIQVIYSLRNKDGYEELTKRLNLNEHQHYQLKSLSNNFSGEIKYSELWLRLGNQSNVYRLELPPKALYAYLTEGKENEEIMDLYRESGDMEKAIESYENQKL